MLLINTPIWCPKISSEMMLQDFDVTKKILNVTFKKMLQKKVIMLQKK